MAIAPLGTGAHQVATEGLVGSSPIEAGAGKVEVSRALGLRDRAPTAGLPE